MSIRKVVGAGGRPAWDVRWHEWVGGRRRKPRRRVYSYADAVELHELMRRRARGVPAQRLAGTVTLDQWAETWRRDRRSSHQKSTKDTNARLYRRLIAPALGRLQLAAIDVEAVRAWQNDLEDLGRSADQIIKARKLLGAILRHAVTARVLESSPLPYVVPPARGQRDEVIPLTPGQIERVRRHLRRPQDQLAVSVLGYAGLRPGELRGLRTADLRERTILIQRALDTDGHVKPTKTGKARTIKVLPPLRADLDRWLLTRAHASAPVIAADDGTPWTGDDWAAFRRRWRRACRRAGLDPIPRPYDLRHSFASLLLAEGRTSHEVAKQLGHGVEQTNRVYGHVIDEWADVPTAQRPTAEDAITRAREDVDQMWTNPNPTTQEETAHAA